MGQGMTEVIKPFVITDVKELADGARGVTFDASKTIVRGPGQTTRIKMTNYVHVLAGEDIDMEVFKFLQNVEWV